MVLNEDTPVAGWIGKKNIRERMSTSSRIAASHVTGGDFFQVRGRFAG
jgi:hypothetical protein